MSHIAPIACPFCLSRMEQLWTRESVTAGPGGEIPPGIWRSWRCPRAGCRFGMIVPVKPGEPTS